MSTDAGIGPLVEVNVTVFDPSPVPPFDVSTSLPVTVTVEPHGTLGIEFNVKVVECDGAITETALSL